MKVIKYYKRRQAYYKINYPQEFYKIWLSLKLTSEKAKELMSKTNEELIMLLFDKPKDEFDDIFSDSYKVENAIKLIIEARERKIDISLD